jgi:hypothetical protein
LRARPGPGYAVGAMAKLRPAVLVLSGALAAAGCFGRWTEKQKSDFAARCARTTAVDGLVVELTGFDFERVRAVRVEEVRDGRTIGSFEIHADASGYDPLRRRYLADVDRALDVRDEYRFRVPGEAPYVLSRMKMVVWPQRSMTSEDYGCVMGDYTLDGVRFQRDANPDLVARAPRPE